MMNYIKSEFYRVLHSRSMYCLIGILTILSFLINLTLWGFGRLEGSTFYYNITSFSFSNLVANPMIFCAIGAVIGIFLYEGNIKNGTLKNTIAFGIPRIKIFAGECIVATVTAIISLIVILTTYIVSAVIFLEYTGPVRLIDLLTEIPAVFFLAVASLISAIACIEVSGKEFTGTLVWIVIWMVIPKAFFLLGLRIDGLYHIAMWMPYNYFGLGSNEMSVNMSQCITLWGTTAGMIKCLVSGLIGTVIFSLSGALLLRKKEL